MFQRRYASQPATTPPRVRGFRRTRATRAAPAGRRIAGTAAAGLAGGGSILIRLLQLVATVVIGIIVLAVILILLDANAHNTIVSHLRDWAYTLTAPFHGIFHLKSAKGTKALNYGIAVVVYAVATSMIARLIAQGFAPIRRRIPA